LDSKVNAKAISNQALPPGISAILTSVMSH
jgi:hypothetical protein